MIIAHIFVAKDIQNFREHFETAEEIIALLVEYDNCSCEKFIDLSGRVDFKGFEDT